jgi:PAS domain S-box-containing protein
LDGTVLEDNQTAIDFCQLERSEAVGHPFWNLKCWTISPETQERLKRAIAQAAAGNIVRYEEDILAPDDTVVTIDFSLKPLKDETGQVELLIAEGRDLTERKRIEQNLQRAVEELTEWRNRYEAADQINGLLFYKWNSQTEAVTWGHNVEQVFGYSREELSGSIEQWMELIHPDDLEKIIQELNRVIASKEPLHIEYRMRQKDGTYITLEDKGLFYPDSSGNLNQMVGFVANITERKQAQEALRESEERWQLALRGNNDGIWDWNIKTNEVFYLARWKEMLGIEEHELSNVLNEWTTRIHPDDLPGVMQAVQEYLERKTPHYIAEYRMRCKDGSYKWILGRGQAVWDETGAPLRMVGSHTDITKRKQAEAALQQALSKLETKVEERTADLKQANEQLQAEINERQLTEMALRQSEEQFRRVFDEATLGMGLTALDGRFFRMNQAWLDMLGYTESELKALTCADITHPEDWEQTIPYLEQVRKGEIDSFQREQRFLKKNQEILWGNLTSIVLREQGGGILCGLGMVEDITERKKALEALQQSEARYRAIVEDQTELICRFKPDGTLTFVNERLLPLF